MKKPYSVPLSETVEIRFEENILSYGLPDQPGGMFDFGDLIIDDVEF